MKSLILTLTLAMGAAALAPAIAEAKRFGGGGSSGMQRSMPARTPPSALPARPATPAPAVAPAAAPAVAAAAVPRRSWMGPIAGIAAGLGIAALMSHFGMGAGFGNLLTMLLFAVIAIMAIRFLMRRFGPAARPLAGPGGMQFASADANAGPARTTSAGGVEAARVLPVPTGPEAAPAKSLRDLPTGFDAAGFERVAKLIFIRMQAANDAADLDDLRNFTTPEMFASVRLDLQQRGSTPQRTDVEKVDAEILDCVEEGNRQLVSVRFHGLIREVRDGDFMRFDEVWHLVRPLDHSHDWAIAGIQQSAA